MKPYVHAKSSAARWGGTPEEYLFLHDFMDSTKSAVADVRHRAVLHSAFGIFLAEQVFGHNYINSFGLTVSIRDLAEQHVQEDLGFIPTLEQWIKNMPIEDWMMGRGGKPSKTTFIPMDDDGVLNTEVINDRPDVYIDGQFNKGPYLD